MSTLPQKAPGSLSQAHQLLALVALSGELPTSQLSRLAGGTSYKENVVKSLKRQRLLLSYYKNGLRGYRLTAAAKKLLLEHNPERFSFYLSGACATNHIRSEPEQRLRLHRVSQTLITMRNANVSIFRDEKPGVFRPGETAIGSICTPAFYTSREIKEMGTTFVKIRGARSVGVLLTPQHIHVVYNMGNALMKWSYKAEMRTKALMQTVLCRERMPHQYRWQPGDAEVKLPYGGASICNAGWENGVLQLVMKGPAEENEWTAPENWYFIDTRTGAVIYPDPSVHFSPPSAFDPDATDADWCYIWEFVTIDKEALPYLEMHWGGKEIYTTVLSGKWKVTLEETPVTIASEVLAENVPLTYGGEELTAERIECSKLSVAAYFADYVDSTTGILGAFRVFDADGKPIPCDWSFTADQADDSCMIWTRFDEPIEPECICRLTFNGETVFER